MHEFVTILYSLAHLVIPMFIISRHRIYSFILYLFALLRDLFILVRIISNHILVIGRSPPGPIAIDANVCCRDVF